MPSWATGWATGDIVTAAEFRKGAGSIFDTTLGASAATIDVTSIPQTYAHLLLTLYARSDIAQPSAQVAMRFNGDAGSNYDFQGIGAIGASPFASEGYGTLGGNWISYIPAANAAANLFGACQVFIPHYAGSVNQKSYVGVASYKSGITTGSSRVDLIGGGWRSTAAINRITVVLIVAGNFVAGTRLTIHALGA